MSYSIGLDLGGTNMKAVAVTTDGTVLNRVAAPTLDGLHTVSDWATSARVLIAELSPPHRGPPASVGLCMPGIVAPDGRSIRSYPGRLRGLEGFDWQTALGQSPAPTLLNDAHAALLAEAWIGAARGRNHAVLFTLGTGVGGAILADGRILRGALGRAGHVGHTTVDLDGPPSIVGMPGALETMIGECTLCARSNRHYANTHALLAACGAGDAEATRVWRRSIHALACSVASTINLLDPEVIILGGGIAQAGDALLVPLAAALDVIEWRRGGQRTPLALALLGEWAGALGAARHSMLSHDTR